jgi:iron complex transport system substrate-binding protein
MQFFNHCYSQWLVLCQGSFAGSATPQNFLNSNFDLRDTPQIKIDKPPGRSRRLSQHFVRLSLFSMLVVCLISACGNLGSEKFTPPVISSSPTNCRMIEHDMGQTTVCGQPQRIAVLAPHMLDILLALGMQPTGYAEFSKTGIGQPIATIPVLGDRVTSQPVNLGLRNTPSLETLLQLKPDLIIGEAFQRQFYDRFSQIAPTLLYEGSLKDEWQHSIQGVAQAIGREVQAQQVIASYQQKLAETQMALAPVVASHPNLLLMAAYQLPETFGVSDSRDFLGGLFADLGFQLAVPILESASDFWLSLEVLPQLKADMILALISDHLRQDAMQHTQQVWQQNPITRSLPASQAGRVYFVDAYLFYNIRGPIAANLILDKIREMFR